MLDDLPKSISTWLTHIQEQSKRYEQTVTTVADTIERVETALQAVGGLGDVLRWFKDPTPAGYEQPSYYGMQIGSVNGQSVLFYARGIAQDGRIVAQGGWAMLRSWDVLTQSNALQFFPEFLKSVNADFQERTERLQTRIEKLTKAESDYTEAVRAKPGLLSMIENVEEPAAEQTEPPQEESFLPEEQSFVTDDTERSEEDDVIIEGGNR